MIKTSSVTITIVLSILLSLNGFGQRHEILIPDIEGYVTLKADLHTHTVFSDGLVWPTLRVEEAWRDGLDVLALTDHIEYTPHAADVKVDAAKPYSIAEKLASQLGILLIQGVELTRSMPPGHMNVLFLNDPEKLRQDDLEEVMQEAARQGAYIFWNHPGWKGQQPDGVVRVYDIHREWFGKGWIHGVEFGNDVEYYLETLQIAREYNLGLLANSDIHGISANSFTPQTDTHRPLTLIFSREKTTEAVREALIQRHMVAWIQNILAGSEQWLRPLLQASLKVELPHLRTNDTDWVTVRNLSAFLIRLERETGDGTVETTDLEPHTTTILRLPLEITAHRFTVANTYTVETGNPLILELEIP
jgi:3',5'-nucleoside bisphosphate phosphatase